MATIHKTDIDLNKNQILNARLQNIATTPSSPVIGQIIYNTTLNAPLVWNGTNWISLFGSSNIYNTDGTFSGNRKILMHGSANTNYFAIRNSDDSRDLLRITGNGIITLNTLRIPNIQTFTTTANTHILGITSAGGVGSLESILTLDELIEMRDYEYWTIDFMDAQTVTFGADKNMKFISITNVTNAPSITIQVNNNPYTLGTNITMGSKIDVSASSIGIIKIRAEIL